MRSNAPLPALVAIVDDDPSVRRSVTSLLQSLDFRVQAFGSAEDFLASDVAATACVALDIKLPEMSGLALLERLRQMNPEVGVVMLTARGDDATRKRAIELGAMFFLSKPFRSEDLVKAVRHLVERRP